MQPSCHWVPPTLFAYTRHIWLVQVPGTGILSRKTPATKPEHTLHRGPGPWLEAHPIVAAAGSTSANIVPIVAAVTRIFIWSLLHSLNAEFDSPRQIQPKYGVCKEYNYRVKLCGPPRVRSSR